MRYRIIFLGIAALLAAGCAMPAKSLDTGGIDAPLSEPVWVRNGEPMQMEDAAWYPTDEVENLLDQEMFRLGQYHGVDVFIERTDVKPFARLYTRFAKNRFRAFEQQ